MSKIKSKRKWPTGSATFYTDQGLRKYQEDRYVYRNFSFGYLMAVFDGHGGASVADKASKNLIPIFENEFILFSASGSTDYKILLRHAVEKIDYLLKNEYCGSTMSLVFIPKNTPELVAYIAILGDSPVVITDSLDNIFLSPNHNVRENLAERELAITRGGFYGEGYIWNPEWTNGLQMGRALGNIKLGSILNHEPELAEFSLDKKSIVIVASDGVFDPEHKSSGLKQTKRFIEIIKAGGKAKDLINDALKRQTGDNATAIVFRMKK